MKPPEVRVVQMTRSHEKAQIQFMLVEQFYTETGTYAQSFVRPIKGQHFGVSLLTADAKCRSGYQDTHMNHWTFSGYQDTHMNHWTFAP